jgi:glycosyltransferase involved in cell wall biosynthesis
VPEPGGTGGGAGPGGAGGPVIFVVPPGRPPSGGDLYNRFLTRALAAAGFALETTTLERLAPESYGEGTEFWVDSLYIPALGERDPFGPGDRLFFIIHSLPSAAPGLRRGQADLVRAIEDGLFEGAAGFLVTGGATKGALAARGFGGVPVLVVPPAPCVVPKRAPGGAPDVFGGLVVSSLIHGKGVPEFLDALGREVRADDRFTLRIAGRTDIEPGTAAACLESVQAHPLLRESVRHLGFVPYEDLGTEYERSSALISPSSNETYGMAFHEARAFGLPILAVRAPYSVPFIEDGRTGLLFASAAELAEGMLGLVREPGRARELAAGAAEARPVSSYTWDDAARSFIEQRRSVQ